MRHRLPIRVLLLAVAVPLALVGCAAPIPTLADFDHFNEEYDKIIAKDIAVLDEKLTNDEISQEQYDWQIRQFEEERAEKVADLVHHNHQLWESYYRSLGIPTSGAGATTGGRTGHSGGIGGFGGHGGGGFGGHGGGGFGGGGRFR